MSNFSFMFYVIYVALSMAFILYGYHEEVDAIKEVNKFKGLNKWISTNATITSSKITHQNNRKYRNTYCYLTYEYQVNGTDYFSTKYDLASNSIDKTNDAHPCSGLKVGDIILCFYNPSNPSESVVKKAGINMIAFWLGTSISIFCTPLYAAFIVSENFGTASIILSSSHIFCGFLFLIYSSFGSYDSIWIAFSTFPYLFGIVFWSFLSYSIFAFILHVADSAS